MIILYFLYFFKIRKVVIVERIIDIIVINIVIKNRLFEKGKNKVLYIDIYFFFIVIILYFV